MPKRDDTLLLEDILESGAKIQRYTTGYAFDVFENDERTIDAVIRNFEIIGEAATIFRHHLLNNIPTFHGGKL
jgi:uncharacterized protein with HEPN domain